MPLKRRKWINFGRTNWIASQLYDLTSGNTKGCMKLWSHADLKNAALTHNECAILMSLHVQLS